MPKTAFTPRNELVCGKLDELFDAIVAGEKERACDLVERVRYDCQRMEAKLIARKSDEIRLVCLVRNIRNHTPKAWEPKAWNELTSNWSLVSEHFCLDSTKAREFCTSIGIDPDGYTA